jgi:hypothetical protein
VLVPSTGDEPFVVVAADGAGGEVELVTNTGIL